MRREPKKQFFYISQCNTNLQISICQILHLLLCCVSLLEWPPTKDVSDIVGCISRNLYRVVNLQKHICVNSLIGHKSDVLHLHVQKYNIYIWMYILAKPGLYFLRSRQIFELSEAYTKFVLGFHNRIAQFLGNREINVYDWQ